MTIQFEGVELLAYTMLEGARAIIERENELHEIEGANWNIPEVDDLLACVTMVLGITEADFSECKTLDFELGEIDSEEFILNARELRSKLVRGA